MSYMEMIYIDSDDQACKTRIGAQFETPAQTWAAFNAARPMAVDRDSAEFLLDYYNRRGDLADTIRLSRAGFEQISGEHAKTDAQYRQIDARYWWRKQAA